MITRLFTLSDQLAFAKLSGDYNPLHIDEIASRRYMFGEPLVHGIHTLLWALDCFLAATPKPTTILSLEADFKKPVILSENVLVKFSEKSGHQLIEISSQSSLLSKVKLQCKPISREDWDLQQRQCMSGLAPEAQPRELTAAEVAKAKGQLELFYDNVHLSQLLPNVAAYLDPVCTAAMLASTRLVGGHCPGLNSLYSFFSLYASDKGKNTTTFAYQTAEYDERFSMAFIDLTTPGFIGNIRAFLRPPPVVQASCEQIKDTVKRDEFVGQKAIIIGGSRGLGEIVAKLLAAGGAEVFISFYRGRDEAEQLVNEIRSNGGKASTFRFNVLSPNWEAVLADHTDLHPSHLYYFATPFIAASPGQFSSEQHQCFSDYYVKGFVETVTPLLSKGLAHIFYPSTVMIDAMPLDMAEYSVAKAAGETVCRFLSKNNKGLRVSMPRLPKMTTDQTASLMKKDQLDPVPVMLDELRAHHMP
ncbi:SDR family NAD(P)-dependent oxidoreductase [Endozoicomonas sp. GU-1]|uniref:SDR family NAD(P)-dependent oxidoreductase n=1 Tax=Endozoicomonas sp. GU-1 TaxID=3009078 RepID=UPI0022B31F06|nr:SDR family NAD(P)-dependent oxidoreductase [Endozoicomonas sp. GU-1]WBA83052.1 SDR family NAD(P)-dependent oxidoreductase [Endozoicomonas sp. GU-1]WBA85974.1 SDR family NAD(P)-dependent oxidoreductase [Endozoicomonas sp. GU-1]